MFGRRNEVRPLFVGWTCGDRVVYEVMFRDRGDIGVDVGRHRKRRCVKIPGIRNSLSHEGMAGLVIISFFSSDRRAPWSITGSTVIEPGNGGYTKPITPHQIL